VPGAVESLIEMLQWAGISIDEGNDSAVCMQICRITSWLLCCSHSLSVVSCYECIDVFS